MSLASVSKCCVWQSSSRSPVRSQAQLLVSSEAQEVTSSRSGEPWPDLVAHHRAQPPHDPRPSHMEPYCGARGARESISPESSSSATGCWINRYSHPTHRVLFVDINLGLQDGHGRALPHSFACTRPEAGPCEVRALVLQRTPATDRGSICGWLFLKQVIKMLTSLGGKILQNPVPTFYSSIHAAKPKALRLYLKRLVATIRARTPTSIKRAPGCRVRESRAAEPRTAEQEVTFCPTSIPKGRV